jgi:hypothetical protein
VTITDLPPVDEAPEPGDGFLVLKDGVPYLGTEPVKAAAELFVDVTDMLTTGFSAAFDPDEIRDPHTGKWIRDPAGRFLDEAAKSLKYQERISHNGHGIDRTKLGYTVKLKSGEKQHYEHAADAAEAARRGKHLSLPDESKHGASHLPGTEPKPDTSKDTSGYGVFSHPADTNVQLDYGNAVLETNAEYQANPAYKLKSYKVSDLIPTQMKDPHERAGTGTPGKPLVMEKGGKAYLIDGHHRAVEAGPSGTIEAWSFNAAAEPKPPVPEPKPAGPDLKGFTTHPGANGATIVRDSTGKEVATVRTRVKRDERSGVVSRGYSYTLPGGAPSEPYKSADAAVAAAIEHHQRLNAPKPEPKPAGRKVSIPSLPAGYTATQGEMGKYGKTDVLVHDASGNQVLRLAYVDIKHGPGKLKGQEHGYREVGYAHHITDQAVLDKLKQNRSDALKRGDKYLPDAKILPGSARPLGVAAEQGLKRHGEYVKMAGLDKVKPEPPKPAPHPANLVSQAERPADVAKGLSDAELKAADTELARRAELLGYAGRVSKAHQAVKDEIASRAAKAKPVPKPGWAAHGANYHHGTVGGKQYTLHYAPGGGWDVHKGGHATDVKGLGPKVGHGKNAADAKMLAAEHAGKIREIPKPTGPSPANYQTGARVTHLTDPNRSGGTVIDTARGGDGSKTFLVKWDSGKNGWTHPSELTPEVGERPIPAITTAPPEGKAAREKWLREQAHPAASAAAAKIYGTNVNRWNGETYIKKNNSWYGVMEWSGSMGLHPVPAQSLTEALDPNKDRVVSDPSGLRTYLHEINHAVGSGDTTGMSGLSTQDMVRADSRDYQGKAGHDYEEGFTEMGAWMNMSEFLTHLGIADKPTRATGPVSLGWENQASATRQLIAETRQGLYTDGEPDLREKLAKAQLTLNAGNPSAISNVEAAIAALDEAGFGVQANELKAELAKLTAVPQPKALTLGEYFDSRMKPETFTSGVAQGMAYRPLVATAYNWLDGIAALENNQKFGVGQNGSPSGRFKRIVELQKEVNAASGPQKRFVMAKQYLRARGLGAYADTKSGPYTVADRLAHVLSMNWGQPNVTLNGKLQVVLQNLASEGAIPKGKL